MPASSSDYFAKTGIGTATTLAAPGHTIGGTTFNVGSTAAYPTTTGVFFAVDSYDTLTGARVPGTYTVWQGEVQNSTTFANCVLRYGTDQNYTAGSTTRVYMPITNARENRLVDGLLVSHDQTGALLPAAVQTALGTGNLANTGFNALGQTPNTVTYNGNRSYSCVFNGVDLSTTLSAGMRIRTTRTVAAPTRSTSLNGTTQYWSKTSPAGMTFTDDFTVMGWVKLSAYGSGTGTIISRALSNSGWALDINASGQVRIYGWGASNGRQAQSYQSLPLNKWVHVAGTLDLSASVGTICIDGIIVPSILTNLGAGATVLTQGGNLEVGTQNGGTAFFPGKIAQAAVFSAVLSAATIQSYYSQGITSSAPSLVSAYSFDGNANDINTTNANNLTASGSAVATNADSPFGGQADGTISSTLDYGIVQKVTFSTNTTVIVQVAEGCTIPTTGGVSAVAYSSQRAPYGFPGQRGKWAVEAHIKTLGSPTVATTGTWYQTNFLQIVAPAGEWAALPMVNIQQNNNAAGSVQLSSTLSTTSTSETDPLNSQYGETSTNALSFNFTTSKTIFLSVATATTYYFLVKSTTGVAPINLYVRGDVAQSAIRLENAYL